MGWISERGALAGLHWWLSDGSGRSDTHLACDRAFIWRLALDFEWVMVALFDSL